MVTILSLLVLLVVTAVVFNGEVRRDVRGIKDSTQMRGIDVSWLVYAREFDGNLPTPSRISRLSSNGMATDGSTKEDITLNTTANLYAACIMQNYFSPELCVGPTEPNPKVSVFDAYNYESYLPAKGVYWDSAFKADLQTGSNVSYAHMPLFGKLRDEHWRETLGDAAWPILGNRGPLDGVADANSYTYKIHPPSNQWSGNICFADNHVEFLTGLPSATTTGNRIVNTQGMFRYDGEDDSNGILAFTKSITVEKPDLQYD